MPFSLRMESKQREGGRNCDRSKARAAGSQTHNPCIHKRTDEKKSRGRRRETTAETRGEGSQSVTVGLLSPGLVCSAASLIQPSAASTGDPVQSSSSSDRLPVLLHNQASSTSSFPSALCSLPALEQHTCFKMSGQDDRYVSLTYFPAQL